MFVSVSFFLRSLSLFSFFFYICLYTYYPFVFIVVLTVIVSILGGVYLSFFSIFHSLSYSLQDMCKLTSIFIVVMIIIILISLIVVVLVVRSVLIGSLSVSVELRYQACQKEIQIDILHSR